MFNLHGNDCKVKFHNNQYTVEFNKPCALNSLLFLFPVPPPPPLWFTVLNIISFVNKYGSYQIKQMEDPVLFGCCFNIFFFYVKKLSEGDVYCFSR